MVNKTRHWTWFYNKKRPLECLFPYFPSAMHETFVTIFFQASHHAMSMTVPSTTARSRPDAEQAIAYDPKCTKIIHRLDRIFDREVIVKVLKENRTRNLYVVANLCAEQTL